MGLMNRRKRKILGAARRSAGQSDLMDEHVVKLKIAMRDHDILGHMTNSRYNELAALGREDYFIRTGLADAISASGLVHATEYEMITFLRMLKAGMLLTLTTRLAGWDGTYLFFAHAFSVKDQCRAQVRCIVALHAADGGRANPARLIEALGCEVESPQIETEFDSALTLLATVPAGH